MLRPARVPPVTPVAALTPRDRAILLALDAYRYLDTRQLAALFFSGAHRAWARLRVLAAGGRTRYWVVSAYPGPDRRSAVHVLTAAGARELALQLGRDPRPLVARAHRVGVRTHQLVHDAEANGFFVSLVRGSRGRPAEGLYHWLGPVACRDAGKRVGTPRADGWGRYVLPDREIHFFLEWDRGTEHPHRLDASVSRYLLYFKDRIDADRHHVLFVVPTAEREAELQRVLTRHVRRSGQCRFATTTAPRVATESALGPVWAISGAAHRVAFASMPGVTRTTRLAQDSIGKANWWERRPAGGEGA